MNMENIFSIVNTIALVSWLLLILLPFNRREYFYKITKYLTFPILGLLYAVLIFPHFISSGGGFDTFENVKKLLSNDWVLLAGWIHYLIFDLFVGIYIAKNLDERKIPKIFQSFFLILTFMFGPAGLLVYFLFNQIIKFTNKYIYFFYPVDWRLGLENKVYSYTLYAWAFSFAL